ncbi:DUF6481 family protein [Rhizobium sp. NFR07]|uniref:DUF6481 family protein n=1 Tax=Rhizobium sp. NFR07 TaxID=1566262 RepID=UPI000B809122|nr:DUF6481 family protein [Rhizobium sp. NFR07]
MRNFGNTELAERRSAAAHAKALLLAAYQVAMTANDPIRDAKHAERTALVQARDLRRVERDRLKVEERNRRDADAAEKQAAIEAVALAETEERAIAESARMRRVGEDDAARKAARDRRYANRKGRQA